jgi:hypothetical protein
MTGKHIGELEALGSLSALRLCYRIGNGCQDFSTMTKGDADFLKISVGHVRQDRDVDVVAGKGRRVSLNANVRQPFRDRLHYRPDILHRDRALPNHSRPASIGQLPPGGRELRSLQRQHDAGPRGRVPLARRCACAKIARLLRPATEAEKG